MLVGYALNDYSVSDSSPQPAI